jgi:choline dehydrogenase-like flavoprotein
MSDHYDVIIIGTGAGGGTLLNKLAPSGKRILVLERGPFLPREKENWTYKGSFKYYSTEVMYNKEGGEIRPGFSYHVGGNTKLFGAALFRLRERDFEAYWHRDGLSPEWPIKYREWEGYYTQAEQLYQVHGQGGADPIEPWRAKDYPFPPISHEPRIAEVFESLKARGLKPYPAPMGVRINEAVMHSSPCIRCGTCDGYPCLVHAKSDADVLTVRPAIREPNVTLVTDAKVLHLGTSASGREITGVVADVKGERVTFSSDVVVVACGAVNSAALLLRSANERHPRGLANTSSDLVGRNLMKHVLGSLVAVTNAKVNPSKFQKTLSLFDYYWGDADFPYPMGQVQMLGKVDRESLEGSESIYAPLDIDFVAKHSLDWWLTSEDLPDPNNRITLNRDGKIVVDYTENNTPAFERLMARWTEVLKSIGCGCHILPNGKYFNAGTVTTFTMKLGLAGLGHQVGSCRFGEDPASSVLDLNCKAHDLDNLYVVDGSFLVSSAAVNPTLTIIANALRVGEHLLGRLGADETGREADSSRSEAGMVMFR